MRKRRLEAISRRFFAFALALIVMLSTVELSSIRVLAAENAAEVAVEETTEEASEEIVEEVVSEDATEEVSEGETEEYDVDTKDEVKALPYTGTISEDDEYGRTLGIYESHMKAHGMQVNAENMIAIIQAQTEPVNRVIIDVSDTSGFHIITKELWNEALTILTENAEFKRKFISFQSYQNSSLYVYEFLNPVKIQQDVDVAFSYEIGEPEEGLSFQFEQVDFACTTFFDFFTIEGCEEYEPMRVAYGLHDSYAFFDGEKQIINQHVSVYTDEPGYVMTSFGFGSVLEPGKTYTIKGVTEESNDELPYMGDVAENEWYGKILTISAEAMDAAGMDVTFENMQKILDAQTQKFQRINFCIYDSELFTVVPKELWNKAVDSMEETEFRPMMTFDWRNVSWCFCKPQTVTEDVGLSLNNSFSEADEGINVVFEQLVIPAELASIELVYDKEHSDFSKIGAFIDETAEYGLFVGKEKFEEVDLHVYDEMYAFTFDCSEKLEAGKTYTIKEVNENEQGETLPPGTTMGPFDENGNYIGYVYTDDEGTPNLQLNSSVLGMDSFEVEACEDIISFWASKGIKFDNIFVTQSAAGGYVIKKDIYEMLRTRILSEDRGQINFQFNNLIEPGEESDGVVIKERNETMVVWGFENPEALESDINGEISIQLNDDKETVLTFADKREYSEGTFVMVSATENNELYKNVLLPGLGEAADFTVASEHPLYVFGEGVFHNLVVSVRYWTDAGYTNLVVDDMSRIEATVPNVLYNPSVTYEKGLLDTVNGLVLTVEEEGAHDISFHIVDGEAGLDHFTEDWVLYGYTPGSSVTVLCTYLDAAGERIAELWKYNTVHGATKFKFTYSEIELEWDGTDNGDVHFLEVAYLPATENIWPDDCTWEVVSGNGIEFLPDYYHENGWGKKYPYKITGFGETVVKASYAGASATCVIRVLPTVKVPAIPAIYAAPQVNATLADIDLNAIVKGAEGTFTWKDSSVKFADYAGADSMQAEALYTVKGRKPVSVLVPVDLVWITGVNIGAYDKTRADGQYYITLPDSMKKDEKIVLCAELLTNNSSKEAVDLLKKYVKEGKLSVKWTDKEKGELLSEELVYESAVFAPRSYTATAKGKKTLQASVMSAISKKAIATGKANLVVTENDVFSFAPEVFELTDANPTEMKGEITVKVTSENYKIAKKLTFKSGDTSVLKLGKAKTENAESFVTITIPYEFVKTGTTTLSVVSADEVKTSKGFAMERVDYTPKMGTASIIIDKGEAASVPAEFIEIFCHNDVSFTDGVRMKEESHAKNFEISDCGDSLYLVSLKNSSLKNGTYTVTLQAPYKVKGVEEKQFESKLKIVVKETKVKLSIKQSEAYNEFYKNGGEIVFTTKVAKGALVDMKIADQNSPFVLEWYGTNKYALVLKDEFIGKDLSAAQKKVTLEYEVHAEGANYKGKTSFTIKTVNKAPKVTGFLSIKSNVGEMNSYYGITELAYIPMFSDTKTAMDSLDGKVQLIDTKTGKLTDLVTYHFAGDNPAKPVKIGKNEYYVYTSWNGIYVELVNPNAAVKATDVMKFRISDDNWKGTVDVTIKNKVINSKAKVKLSQSTVTMNVNEAIYRDAHGYISVTIGNSGNLSSIMSEGTEITGLDEKSKKAMEHNLKIEGYPRDISIFIVDKGDKASGTYLETGTYKYKAETKIGKGTVSFNFKVKVVDESPEKSIKVTKKGSIDVLDRYDTCVTLSVKAKGNLADMNLEDMYLEGADASLFEAYFDGIGSCEVYAKEGVQLSTKTKYKVTPVCKYGDVIVKAAPVTIQVKQGSVKFAKASHGDTLYANKGNEMILFPDAYTNGKWIAVKNVELLNYTDDLKYENGILSFRTDKEPTTIKKSQGTYTLKFAVTLADGAVDKKPLTFTCKVKIVR